MTPPCARCGRRPRYRGHPWCAPCRREAAAGYRRAARERRVREEAAYLAALRQQVAAERAGAEAGGLMWGARQSAGAV